MNSTKTFFLSTILSIATLSCGADQTSAHGYQPSCPPPLDKYVWCPPSALNDTIFYANKAHAERSSLYWYGYWPFTSNEAKNKAQQRLDRYAKKALTAFVKAYTANPQEAKLAFDTKHRMYSRKVVQRTLEHAQKSNPAVELPDWLKLKPQSKL